MRTFTLTLTVIIVLAASTAEAGIFKRKARRHHAEAVCVGGSCAAAPAYHREYYREYYRESHRPAPVYHREYHIAPPATCPGGACRR